MCGIAGWLDAKPIDRRVLERMTRSLAHRGPDGEGIAIFDGGAAGFGHRRLAILDLADSGAQPMSLDGHWLVQNGEIYNFRELRADDRRPDLPWRGTGDAEALLHALVGRGHAALDAIEGMFAFAWFDPRERSLLLARDRIGIKPLYWFEKGDTFLFASEPKALLAHPAVGAVIDPEAAGDFLSYGYVPFDRCIFAGVHKLPAGHALVRKDGTTSVFRYWDPQPVAVRPDAAEELRERLRASVRSHSVADVPVGCFLSGGLDSTAVTALLQADSDAPVPTFTVAYRGGGQEDVRYAAIAAEHLGTRHVAEPLTMTDVGSELDRIGDAFDEPLSDATSLAVFHLSALARTRVKVVLSGDGGDEVFGGYGWHESSLAYEARRATLAPLLPLLGWMDRNLLSPLAGRPWGARAAGLRKLAASDAVDRYFALRGFFTKEERRAMFRAPLSGDDPAWLFRRFYRTERTRAARLCELDLRTYLPDNNLALVDRASMAHGLEVRVPLLDRRVVELALSLPDEALVRPGATKILFRDAIAPWLPAAIMARPKYGFSPPFKRWVSAERGRIALERLRRGPLAADGLLDVRALSRRVTAGMPKRWNKLWQLVVFDRWYRRWIVGTAAERETATPQVSPPIGKAGKVNAA